MQLYPRSLAFGRAPLRTCFGRHLSLGSISALNTGALPQSLPDFTVLRTNVPTIFTCAPIEPVVELDHITTRSNVLFKQAARYIPPKELGYELPLDGLPEFAFVGRSNVGKSTLVGTLLGVKGLVKVSKSPGCTQNINYFAFEAKKKGKLTYLVDLPGYGYASAAKADRQRWADIMGKFLKGRDFSVMRRVYVLVDSRRGVKESDQDMMTLLNDAGLPYQIVLTKADCVSARELYLAVHTAVDAMRLKKRNGCFPFVHTISAKTGLGLADFKRDIARTVYREAEEIIETEAPLEGGA